MGELRIAHAEPTVAGYVARMTSGPVIETDLTFDTVTELRSLADRFIELVTDGDRDASIQACSSWTVADLALHVGDAWRFWAHIVRDNVTDRGALRDITSFAPSAPDQLTDGLQRELDALLEALTSSDMESTVWTWTGANRPIAWVARRLLHETGVHLHDAATALRQPFDISPAVAADGIDEFLTWFAATERGDGELKVGGTVHLHCTDTEPGQGEWFVSAMKEPAATFTREHRKGDAAIRGTALDLLLWLWRRTADVEVIGDKVVARRFRAFTLLD